MTDNISMKDYIQIERIKIMVSEIIAKGGMPVDNVTEDDIGTIMVYMESVLRDIKNLSAEDKINHLVKIVIVNAAQAASLYKKLNEKKDEDE